MKRTALPGGAPLRTAKKRKKAAPKKAAKPVKPPCKYGPRGEDGLCPKRPPVTTQKKAAKGKPPCKYGPRIDGYCPKKPKASKPAGSGGFLDRDIPQGYTPAGNKRAPTSVRKEAKKVLEVAVRETAQKAIKDAVAAYKKDPERVKGLAAEFVKFMGKLGLLGAAVVAGVQLGSQAKRQREAEIERLTFLTVNKIKSDWLASGRKWEQAWSNALIPQHRQFFTQQALRFVSAGGK